MGGCRVCAWWCLVALSACGGKSGNHAATAEGGAGSGGMSTAGAGAASGSASGAASGSSGDAGAAGGDDETGGQGSGDAGGEGGAGPEPVPTFCDEQPHQFCADFDGEDYDAGWHSKDEVDGGTLAPTTLQVMSQPRALVSQIAVQEFKRPTDATFNVTFPAGATGFVLNFDLMIDEAVTDPTSGMPSSVSLFRMLNGDTSLGWDLTFDQEFGDSLWFDHGGGVSARSLGDTIPLQTWLHVEVTVTYDVLETGTYVFRLGHAPEVVWMNSTVGELPGPLQLQLGLETERCDADVRAIYDNVTLDIMP